ncbi:unnamed protein product, partial [Linum tenue]
VTNLLPLRPAVVYASSNPDINNRRRLPPSSPRPSRNGPRSLVGPPSRTTLGCQRASRRSIMTRIMQTWRQNRPDLDSLQTTSPWRSPIIFVCSPQGCHRTTTRCTSPSLPHPLFRNKVLVS